MKDFMKDNLIVLANAQEFMTEIADNMTVWDNSQLVMEKSAFESLNLSDEVLNLSKNGVDLVGRLLECCHSLVENPCAVEQSKVKAVLKELLASFDRIIESSVNINEISHSIEAQAAVQKDLEEEIKKSIAGVSESINAAAACAEFIMTEF